jgi:hypothetical protein
MVTDPLAPLVRRQRRDINTLFAVLADSLNNAVHRLLQGQDGQRVITEADRIAMMRHIDRDLDIIWGARPDDPDAAVRQIVVRDTRVARFRPLDAAVKRWRRVMTPALQERVEREARRG